MLKKQIKELITSYINFVDVYEVNISETKLERIKKVMYDFSNFVDEYIEEFVHDEDNHSYDDYNSTDSYYIMNDETGRLDEYDSSLFDDEDDLALVVGATEATSLSTSIEDIAGKSRWIAVDFTQDLRLIVNGENINVDLPDEFFVGRRLVHLDTQSNPERDFFMALFELSSQEDINEKYESLLDSVNLASGTNFSLFQGDVAVAVNSIRHISFENVLFKSDDLRTELIQSLLSATLSHATVELSFEILACHESN